LGSHNSSCPLKGLPLFVVPTTNIQVLLTTFIVFLLYIILMNSHILLLTYNTIKIFKNHTHMRNRIYLCEF